MGAHNIGDKPENLGRPLGQLVRYLKRYLPAIIAAVLMAAAGTVIRIIGPNKLREITDIVVEGMAGKIDTDAVTGIGLMLVTLYAAGFVLNYVQGFIMNTVTQKIGFRMRSEASGKINRLPLKYFDSNSFGDVMSRVTNDVDAILQTLTHGLVQVLAAVTMFIGSLIMMFSINVTMTLSAVAATAVGFAGMMLIMGKTQKYFKAQQDHLGEINGHIEEIYSGHTAVKAYNAENSAKQTFREINDKLKVSGLKSQFLSGIMMPLMMFIGNLGYVAVCVVGAAMTFDGKVTIGDIVAFMIYIRLFTQPLSTMAQTGVALQSMAAAGERIFKFMAEPELPDDSSNASVPVDTVKGNVEFKNVRFGYTKEKIIIRNFSATVKAGQKIAIVGPTGAGKTTMVNLLMKFYDLDGGGIYIDGVPISSLKRSNVSDLFCMVLQDTWLFEGTIKENIIYNKEGVTDKEVRDACKTAGIDHFIKTLHCGYDTVLTDNDSLSAGQKQLLTIARAMIENSPMLILDEATSSIDTRTELLIQAAMDKLTVGRTSFIIAHRLSTIKNADLILVMKDGDIIENGTHTGLLEQDGFYAQLYNSQFDSH
ncbi:MAG: ABC transporter ATP-binding protein/permease [Oscillospiraceae bacterium]|nr:ABC transporter ATP-binding protein/permease [Oscillospiraceae bacterium]